MWTKKYTKIYKDINKTQIWRHWADVNNWPKWDDELEYCRLQGPFAAGSQFILKPVGGPKVTITLSHVVENERFTDYCQFLGAQMVDDHLLEETDEGLRFTSTITVTGPLSFLWVWLVAKKVANSLPKNFDQLVKMVARHEEKSI